MYYILVLIISLTLVYYKYNKVKNNNEEEIVERIYALGSGEKNTYYNKYGDLLNDSLPDISISNLESKGSSNNIEKVDSGAYDFGICQEDDALNAILGINRYEEKKMENIRFVGGLFYEYFTFIVQYSNNIDTNMKSFVDLKKERKDEGPYIIGIPPKGSGGYNNFITLCKINNITPIDKNSNTNSGGGPVVLYESAETNTIFNKFTNFELDGIFVVRGSNDIYIRNLVNKHKVEFIPINVDEKIVKDMYGQFYFKKYIDTSNYYKEFFLHDQIPTIATRAICITHKDIENDVVYAITKSICNNYKRFINKIVGKKSMDVDFDKIDIAYSKKWFKIHPGAIELFKEKDIISTSEKYKYDLDNYAENVIKNYWEFDTIGIKKFNIK